MPSKPPFKTAQVNEVQTQYLDELGNLVNTYIAKMPRHEVLACTAVMVGKLLAIQDGRLITVATLMEMIQQNIDEGNRAMIKLMEDRENQQQKGKSNGR